MEIPKIDLESLPELDTAMGVFGSIPASGGGDTVVSVMIYLFDHMMVDMRL